MKKLTTFLIAVLILSTNVSSTIFGQKATDELAVYNDPPSRFRGVIERFDEDYGILNRFYSAQTSPMRMDRFRQLYYDELAVLAGLDFDKLNHDEQVDYILFKNYLEHEQKELQRVIGQFTEVALYLPFARSINDSEESRRRLETIDSAKAAQTLNDIPETIRFVQGKITDGTISKPKRTVANRAARTVGELKNTLRRWYTFYNAYDPLFTWWCESPYKAADDARANTRRLLRVSSWVSPRMTR